MGSRSGSCGFADGLTAFEKISKQQSAEREAAEERAVVGEERTRRVGRAIRSVERKRGEESKSRSTKMR